MRTYYKNDYTTKVPQGQGKVLRRTEQKYLLFSVRVGLHLWIFICGGGNRVDFAPPLPAPTDAFVL